MATHAPGDSFRQSRLRLLYVEDNPQDAELTRRHFAEHAPDFDVEIAATGRHGLERLRSGACDVVLLDYRLPDMDGLDVLKSCSAMGIGTPIVVITGVGDEQLVVRALRLGAVNYVPKQGGYLDTLPELLRAAVGDAERRVREFGAVGNASPCRVLYVEHQMMDVELTIRHLRESAPHIRVDVVHTCADAMVRLEQPHTYDLVLVDLRMPDQSALEFVREARSRRVSLPPFIVISGKGDDAAAIAALRLGAADYLAKREGYLEQLPHTIDESIARDRLRRLNEQLRTELAERARAEQSLRTSEVLYRDLFIANPNPMWVYDLETFRFLEVNDIAIDHYGYSRDEFLSMTIADIRPPEDLPKLRGHLTRIATHKLDRSGIWRHKKRDGTLIDVEITSHQLVVDGRSAKLVMATDVTDWLAAQRALLESEARFRATFEQAAVGIAHVAPDGRYLRVNQRLCDIVGYSRDELLEMTFQAITCPDDLAPDLANTPRLLAGEISTYAVEKRYIRKDGSLVWVNITVTLVHEPSGEPSYFISVVEDVSSRKRAEAEREKLEAQFQQSQKMESVGRLAGGVAHDFNNMLTVVRGYAEMALEKLAPSDPLRADLNEIRIAGNRSAELVQQLLAFARKQTIAPQVLDLNEALGGMLKMIGRLIGEDIDLAFLPGHNVGTVFMDPAQVNQVLVNLAVNARDAIGGTGRITVETANVELNETSCASREGAVPGLFVQLAVSDTGCGMDAETQARIFEPFFTTKPPGKGTGLGLSTVYGIVQQNGGFINVYSEPGHGTTFKIYLPRRVSNSGASGDRTTVVPPTGTEVVLLAEDDVALLTLARRMLESLGYRVLAAGSPQEAIELASGHKGTIDLLVTDVIMPTMTGRALREQVAPMRPGLKCLFTSGYTADVISHQGVLEQEVHFLQKPFSVEDLARKVREALDA